MDLACAETSNKCIRAGKDRAIFRDERVITNLLKDEGFYVPNCDYFTEVQNDIQPFMRKVVTTWMLEVSLTFHRLFLTVTEKTVGFSKFPQGKSPT